MTIYKCFPGGKFKVLTFSYDDGKQEDRRLVEIFNKNNLKGTFNINSGLFDMDIRINADEIKDLYKGHEVACHTLTHPTIARCPLPEVIDEILEDRKNLEKLVGVPVQGLAYPNGSYSKEIIDLLPALGIKHARIVGNSDNFAFPENFLEWKSTCHHNHNLMELGKQFAELNKKQYLYMMYVWGHSYEFTNNDNWDLIEGFCEMMGNRDDIWYATNLEIVNYLERWDRLVFAADRSFVYNPSVDSCWLSIDNDKIVEIPGGETVYLN